MSLVQHGHGAIEGLAEGDTGTSEAIPLALELELVLPVLELEGQVSGEGTGMVQAEDQRQLLFGVKQRPMGVGWILGRDGEAPVVGIEKLGQEGVGRFDVTDPPQAQFLDQTVLQGLVGPFHPALGLGRVGMDGLDVEGFEGPGELGQLAFVIRMVDPEDAVLVGVEGHRAPVLAEIAVEGFHVGLGGLCGRETQGQQLAGGVVDEDDERTVRPAPLEPVVGGAVDLNQLSPAGPARTALVDARRLTHLELPQPLGDHPLAQRLDGELVLMPFGQLLTSQSGPEIGIVGPDQIEDLPPDRVGDPIVGGLAPATGNQAGCPLGPVALHQALDLPHAQAQLPGRILLPKPLLHHLPDHSHPIQLLSTHRNALLCHGPS